MSIYLHLIISVLFLVSITTGSIDSEQVRHVVYSMDVGILHEDSMQQMGNPVLELIYSRSPESQVYEFCNIHKIYIPQCQQLLALVLKNIDEMGITFVGANIPSTVAESTLTTDQIRYLQEFVDTLTDMDCRDQLSTQRFKKNLQHMFSPLELARWQAPDRYIQRDISRASVPCNHRYWMYSGDWDVVPMWAHSGNKEVSTSKCDGDTIDIVTYTKCGKMEGLRGRCNDDSTTWCNSSLINNAIGVNDCTVLSFGIGGIWTFEDFASDVLGCEVHAFDPTTSSREGHMSHQHKNVSFHYLGLSASSSGQAAIQSTVNYGSMDGEFKTLEQIQACLLAATHNRRLAPITILKMDCEGCEWTTLRQIATESPHQLDTICMLVLELHLSTPFDIVTSADLSNAAFFWEYYIHRLGFRVQYFHRSPGAPYDRNVHPLLIALGLEPNVCCYELILIRNSCL